MDTPPLKARPPSLQTFCLEGVHVLVVVARVDRPCSAHVQKLAAVRTKTFTCGLASTPDFVLLCLVIFRTSSVQIGVNTL